MLSAKTFVLSSLFVFLLWGCTESSDNTNSLKTEDKVVPEDFFSHELHFASDCLDSAIIEDLFSPPVASRIYLYPFLACYESLAYSDDSMDHILSDNELTFSNNPVMNKMRAIFSFYFVAQELVYTTSSLEEGAKSFEKRLLDLGFTTHEINNVKAEANLVLEVVASKMNNDGYKNTRTKEIYEPIVGIGYWEPTPPDYRNALEPHWSSIQSISLDSNNQFRCKTPPEYSLEIGSQFRTETDEVRNVVDSLKQDDDKLKSAKFWDCNPFVPVHTGHLTVAEKKLTPGGHWINIAKNAMRDKKTDFEESVKIYAVLSIGIFDGFLSCWEAKYHYNYIRPITVIQNNMDENWSTVLYTPNFPEYPSGHSVISGSASTILTEMIGDNYSFTDSSELPFGMPPRSYNSFYEARDEAALSRLFGGIHFRSAIEEGVEQGNKIGSHVLSKFK